MLLPGSQATQAEVVLARIGARCALLDKVWTDGPLGISAGIVDLEATETPQEFVHRADRAMYLKKLPRTAPR